MTENEEIFELNRKMSEKIKSLGLPYTAVSVHGYSVYVRCRGKKTAEKWYAILRKFVKCSILKILVEDKVNKGGANAPSQHYEYSISGLLIK